MHSYTLENNGSLRRLTNQTIFVFSGLLLIYLLNPLISIIFLIGCLVFARQNSYILIMLLAVSLSVFTGIINSTKAPESDLVNYLEWYELARNTSFVTYFGLQVREPAYFTFLWALANLFDDKAQFVFIHTAIAYFIYLVSIIIFCHIVRLRVIGIVSVLLFATLFFPLFNYSAHLMRQFISGAVIVYLLASRFRDGKEHWCIFVGAVLLHSSAVIFLPLLLVTRISRLSPALLLFSSTALLYAAIIAGKYSSGLLSSIPYVGYIAERVAENQLPDHKDLGLIPLLYVITVLLLSIYKLYDSTFLKSPQLYAREKSICIIAAILCIFVLGAYLHGETMIAIRFLLYIYFVSIFIFILSFSSNFIKIGFYFISFIISPLLFYYNIVNGPWSYGSILQIVFLSPFIFFPV